MIVKEFVAMEFIGAIMIVALGGFAIVYLAEIVKEVLNDRTKL